MEGRLRDAEFSQKSRNVKNNMTVDIQGCTHVEVPSDLFIPIFVLTRDRIISLQKALDSYRRRIETRFEIIILDHHSSYPPMVRFLDQLRKDNTTVFSLEKVNWHDAMGEADTIIRRYLDQQPSVEYYVVTDPDIALLRSLPDALIFYAGLLRSCSQIKVVGPSLQISDIPASYKQTIGHGRSAFEWEKQFWTKVPNMATWNDVGYHLVPAGIDTTFAMRRRGLNFARLQSPSYRVYAPYGAVHLDWYGNSTNLTADKVYYNEHSHNVNHW